MNNKVQIIYEKTERFPKILINDESISRYMTLTNYMYDDAYNWADIFFESMDDEILDTYIVELTGHPLHKMIFESEMGHSRFCEKINFKPIEYGISLTKKYELVADLNKKYNFIQEEAYPFVDITCKSPEQYANLSDVSFNLRESRYYLCTEDESPDETTDAKLVIKQADAFSVKKDGNHPVICIPDKDMQTLVDYLNVYNLRLKFISSFLSAKNRLKIDEKTAAEISAIIDEKMQVIVKPIQKTLDVGEIYELKYQIYPSTVSLGSVYILSKNPNIIVVNGNKIKAISAGTATIEISTNDGEIVYSESIQCFERNYVKNITVFLDSTSVLVGEKVNFNVVLSPENADDKDEIVMTVSDESIAVLTSKHELHGVSSGRVCVTVSGKRTERRFYVTVAPKVAGLAVAQDKIKLGVNAIAKFGCSYYPANAVKAPNVKWKTSDSGVVKIDNQSQFEVCVITKNPGRATITCYCVDEPEIKKDVEIIVS